MDALATASAVMIVLASAAMPVSVALAWVSFGVVKGSMLVAVSGTGLVFAASVLCGWASAPRDMSCGWLAATGLLLGVGGLAVWMGNSLWASSRVDPASHLVAGAIAMGIVTLPFAMSLAAAASGGGRVGRSRTARSVVPEHACVGCGYDLRGLGRAGNCPECEQSFAAKGAEDVPVGH